MWQGEGCADCLRRMMVLPGEIAVVQRGIKWKVGSSQLWY